MKTSLDTTTRSVGPEMPGCD